ncbi:MAG: SEC-C domain-containing protein, partial [Spirochaetaceae bacterium]|nr:SEC-C domain-containing protein [Spirochaetaceae bacterium]
MYYNSGMNASDYNERLKTTGRNDLCPCGSGKKYKKCHL